MLSANIKRILTVFRLCLYISCNVYDLIQWWNLTGSLFCTADRQKKVIHEIVGKIINRVSLYWAGKFAELLQSMLWIWTSISASWDIYDNCQATVESGAQHNHFSTSITWFEEGLWCRRYTFSENVCASGSKVGMIPQSKAPDTWNLHKVDLSLWHGAFTAAFGIFQCSPLHSTHTISSYSPSPCCELCCREDISIIYSLLRLLSEINWFLCLSYDSNCWV